MTFNHKYLLSFGVISLLFTVLFVGQFYDHHGDRTMFVKHRPTFQQIFSPHSPKNPANPTVEEKFGAKDYKEFIIDRDLQKGHGNIFVPAVFIQLSLMLLISGMFSLYKMIPIHEVELIVQFVINLFVTWFLLSYALFTDDLESLFWVAAMILSNYLTIMLLTRKDAVT